MKKLFTILILLTSLMTFAQRDIFRFDYTNKKTKQWLHWTGSSSGGHGHFEYFTLISKINTADKKEFKIPETRFDGFIDSLKKAGFVNNVKSIDRAKQYSPNITLESITFDKMQEQDSIFKFSYIITLTSLKTKLSQTFPYVRYGTEKNSVLAALNTKDYKFDSIIEIKGASIIRVGFYSDKILFPDKGHDLGVFAPWTCFYF